MTTRCAIYVRLSKLDAGRDVQETSIPRQERDCRTYADLRGWTVVDVYSDVDTSAFRKVKRPGFERMLADVAAGLIDVIQVWKLDRLLRRAAEFERVWAACEKAGANLASVHDSLDTTHETGRAVARILVAMAQLESEQMSLRIRGAKADAKAAGKPRSGGTRPFGLSADWREVVPEEAALIKEAAARILAGRSIRSVVLDWNARGATTTSGGRWTAPSLRQLLLQERLCPSGNQAWPALLDDSTCLRLRALLLDPNRTVQKRGRPPNLLTGYLRCGRCGGVLKAGQPRNGKRRYACAAKPEGCNQLAILAEPLEEFVTEAVLVALDTPALTDLADSGDGDDPLVQVARLEDELDELARLQGEGAFTVREWQAARAPLVRRLDEARSHVADVTVRQVHQGAAVVERWDDLATDERRAVLNEVLEKIVVLPARRRGPGTPITERVKIAWRA